MTNLNELNMGQLHDYINKVYDTFQLKDKPKSRYKEDLLPALIATLKRYGYNGIWNTRYIDFFLRIYNLPDKRLSDRLLFLAYDLKTKRYYIDNDIINMINQAEMEYIDNLYTEDFNNEIDSPLDIAFSDSDDLFYPDGEYDFSDDLPNKTNSSRQSEIIDSVNNSQINNNDNIILSSIKTGMQEQNEYINPLEQLIAHTITLQDLINIYNRYAPQPTTAKKALQNAKGDENKAKAQILNDILLNAREGSLVRTGGGFSHDRIGMMELGNIILNLQRDVQRVKKAISPMGAEDIVNKHNLTAKPSAHWKLNKINNNQPATLTNLTDINNDGVPDVVISNSHGQPIFVNGYTTKQSNYPIDLAYYNQYPNRKSRRGYPLNTFKKELYNITYNDPRLV